MDFSKIDANNKSLNSLLNAFSKTRFAKTDFSDETEWYLQKDKNGNGYAKIRFIPSSDGEYFVEMRNHGFKIRDSWFIENCPKTLDWENPCPVCNHADSMKKGREWETIPPGEQSMIRPMFAKTSYWAIILVEKDPANPDNEGKVFKFRFGKKILEKVYNRAVDDPLDGTKGVNVFHPVEGASFKLKSKTVAGYINYDESSFENPTALFKGNEDKINALIEGSPSLKAIRAGDKFKSFEELEKKLKRLLGAGYVAQESRSAADVKTEEKEYDSTDDFGNDSETILDDSNDAMDYFKQLAEDDTPF